MSRIESVVIGVVLLAMTLLLVVCALAISALLWVPVAMLVWANLIYWGV